MPTPNFDLIWSQTSPLTPYEFNDADYQEGWNTVGSTPPARTMFDAQQRQNDLKAQNLNNRLQSVENSESHKDRQKNTTYALGDIVLPSSLSAGWYLVCTTAGTTSSNTLVISTPEVGMLITDGTVVWKVMQYSLGAYLLTRSSAYAEGDIAFYYGLPAGWYLECTTAGTTGSSTPDFSSVAVGDTVSDGTVAWTVRKIGSSTGAKREPLLTLDAASAKLIFPGDSATITASHRGDGTLTASTNSPSTLSVSVSGNVVTVTRVAAFTMGGTAETVTISLAETETYFGDSTSVSVDAVVRYGYRIKESESNPSARVEYLFDAVGMTPAKMDYTNGIFDFGSWADKWFVAYNKPLMLKYDGTVDYYLNPNNYDLKEDGTSSNVSNTTYDGNAMAQIPLVWVKRYEADGYAYEIISNVQYDSDYKAYAHTRADGTIADFFYHSMFGASGSASKLRSLSGQNLAQSLTTDNQLAGATANGSKWYINSWSQRELIRTLLVLMGKSTDTQTVFGNGNCHSAAAASGLLATGTLKNMGQFYGYNDSTHQVKVFHIEGFWGDQWIRTAGIINSGGKIYAKMTPEGSGYQTSDVSGYTDTGVSTPTASQSFISSMQCSQYGMIPTAVSGSGSTFFCDGMWSNNSQLDYLLAGAGAGDASTFSGAFTFNVNHAPSYANWNNGCGLSCEQPSAA